MSNKHDVNAGYPRDCPPDRAKVAERRERDRRKVETRSSVLCPVRVVLSNGEGDERDLGIFNQGVKFGVHGTVFDVATGKVIVGRMNALKVGWFHDGKQYNDLFIHGAQERS